MPAGGLITALIGAAGSIGGGLLGKSAGNLNPNQKQAYNLLNYNAQNASPYARYFGNMGQGFLRGAQGALSGPQNFFQQLLSGNQAATSQALAPDINRIRQQNQGILQSTSTLAPRGAGRSGSLFNLPFQTSSNISGLFNQARPMAAEGLQRAASLLAQLGLGSGALGTNFFNSGNYAAGLMGNMGTQGYNQQNAAGQGLGGLLSGVLQKLPGMGGGGLDTGQFGGGGAGTWGGGWDVNGGNPYMLSGR